MVNIKSLFPAMIMSCCLTAAAQNIHVHGTVQGIKDGSTVYLMLSDGRSSSSIAYDTIQNGAFSLKATVDEGLSIANLSFSDRNVPAISGREFYLSPGADIEVDLPGIHALRSYQIKSNIPEQLEFDSYIDKNRRQNEELTRLYAAKKPYQEMKAPRDSLTDIMAGNSIELLSQSAINDVWLYILTNLAWDASIRTKDGHYRYLDDLIALYERIPEYRRDDTQVQRIKNYLYPPKITEIGDVYTDAEMFDIDGNSHSLSEFVGKWILLDFWSRGCYPCIMAIPELEKFANAHPDDVAVVSISSDAISSWKDTSKTHNMTWHNWSDGKMDAGIFADYGCTAIPTFVIISPEGKIVDKWEGFGKGKFEGKLQSQIYLRKSPIYLRNSGRTWVEYPCAEKNATNNSLYISKIENTDNGITLFFDAYSSPDLWLRIASEPWIQTADGTKYKAVGTKGITLGKEFYVAGNGRGEFSITFEPIPADAEVFDFYESENPSDFHITGLRLAE